MIRVVFIAILLVLTQLPVTAQGLTGTPTCGRSHSAAPPLLKGKTDNERWLLIQEHTNRLIGQTHQSLVKVFGPGLKVGDDAWAWQVSTTKKGKPGELACLELEVRFKDKRATYFKIQSVTWASG